MYVVGNANDALDGNPSNGEADIFITKYNSDGDRLWTRLLGTDNHEMGYGIAVVAGNIYITGHTYGDFLGGSNQGDRDIFIAKYDTDGARQWVEQLGTSLADEGLKIALDSASNIYVAGYTSGALIGNEHQGQQDYFITKHDNDGQLLWALQGGGNLMDTFFGLAIDSADNIYAAGDITVLGQCINIIIAKYGDNLISDDDGLYTVGGTVGSPC